ncbi:MAG: hypothetical protein CL678_03305 [Bdellovibrionaceae bacterium]|nr:hypothetical protein [Pseudobdellovibrionaceae bacterium]
MFKNHTYFYREVDIESRIPIVRVMKTNSQWKNYLPAAGFFFVAWFFMAFPAFAAFLLSAAFIFMGVVYASLVKKIHDARKYQSQYDHFHHDEPNFKNVTIRMFKQGGRWTHFDS